MDFDTGYGHVVTLAVGVDAGPVVILAVGVDAGPVVILAVSMDIGHVVILAVAVDTRHVVILAVAVDTGHVVILAMSMDTGHVVIPAVAVDTGQWLSWMWVWMVDTWSSCCDCGVWTCGHPGYGLCKHGHPRCGHWTVVILAVDSGHPGCGCGHWTVVIPAVDIRSGPEPQSRVFCKAVVAQETPGHIRLEAGIEPSTCQQPPPSPPPSPPPPPPHCARAGPSGSRSPPRRRSRTGRRRRKRRLGLPAGARRGFRVSRRAQRRAVEARAAPRGHGEAAAGAERPGRRGAGPHLAGPGCLHPQFQHPAEVVRHLLCERHLLLHPGHRAAVASWWCQAVRRVLHLWEPRRLGKHLFPHGTRQAAEEDVRDHAATRHSGHVAVPGVDPVCCALVEQEGAGPALLHPAVPVHDLVQPVLHPLRQGRRHQVLLLPGGLKLARAATSPASVRCGQHPGRHGQPVAPPACRAESLPVASHCRPALSRPQPLLSDSTQDAPSGASLPVSTSLNVFFLSL